ncbi:MAG: hypothetical protein GQ582_12090 [Methyloprofundus sp.]|nr:hypothetical protein [Methyloprofundus sp.]
MKSKKILPSIVSTVAIFAMLNGCTTAAKKLEKQHQASSDVNSTLDAFYIQASNAREIVYAAPASLVCPKITKGGFLVGVESGICALQVNGITQEYYHTTAVKMGLLAGVESHSMILIFNDMASLEDFRIDGKDLEVGSNLSITTTQKGASGAIDAPNTAINAYIFSDAGLMGDLSLEGTTFKKLSKE